MSQNIYLFVTKTELLVVFLLWTISSSEADKSHCKILLTLVRNLHSVIVMPSGPRLATKCRPVLC